MDKKLAIGLVAGCALVVSVAAWKRTRRSPQASLRMRGIMEDRMRQRIEQMPEDFPPRIVRDQIPAIKADTERILALLSEESPRPGDPE